MLKLGRDFIVSHEFKEYRSDDREFNGEKLGPVGSKIRIDFRTRDGKISLSPRRRLVEITDIDLANAAGFESVDEIVRLLRMNGLSRYLGEAFNRLKTENEARMSDLGLK